MNVRKDSGTDEQIKQAIREGKTQLQIISELNTHSQRIQRIKKEMNNISYTYQTKLKDSFILNCY